MAVLLLAGVQSVSEEVSVAVTTPRPLHLAHPDPEDMEAHQRDQEASEEEDSAVASRVAVEEVVSEEDSTVRAVEVGSEADLMAHAVVEEATVEVVAELDTSRTALAVPLTVRQQVPAVPVVEASVEIAAEATATVRNMETASKVPVEAIASQLDHVEEDTATAINTVAAMPVVVMAVDATIESALTTVMDTTAAARREGTD